MLQRVQGKEVADGTVLHLDIVQRRDRLNYAVTQLPMN